MGNAHTNHALSFQRISKLKGEQLGRSHSEVEAYRLACQLADIGALCPPYFLSYAVAIDADGFRHGIAWDRFTAGVLEFDPHFACGAAIDVENETRA